MNFASLQRDFKWLSFDNQMDSDVTYVFVGQSKVPRMIGVSDILYIGKTEQAIKIRFEQETRASNSPKNTQQTNIRMTYILDKIGTNDYQCFYVRKLVMKMSGAKTTDFLEKIKTWDKQFFLKLMDSHSGGSLDVPIEKYLLVTYTHEHLELPPLNNRM